MTLAEFDAHWGPNVGLTGSVWLFVLFVAGLLFGSFLNVCISRLPQDESVVRPRSRCPLCSKPIRPWDNIPLLSWLLLRGRCRDCHGPIGWRYAAVELATGVWFAGSYLIVNGHSSLVLLNWLNAAVLGFLLIGLAIMDAETGLLPDEFTLGGGFAGLVLFCAYAFMLPDVKGTVFLTAPEKALALRLLAVLASVGFLLLIRWLYWLARRREGMGMGDVKMMGMMAIFLGLVPAMLALFVAILAGAAVGVFVLLSRRAPRQRSGLQSGAERTELPFGCFLALGGFYVMLFGRQTLDWYMQFFH